MCSTTGERIMNVKTVLIVTCSITGEGRSSGALEFTPQNLPENQLLNRLWSAQWCVPGEMRADRSASYRRRCDSAQTQQFLARIVKDVADGLL